MAFYHPVRYKYLSLTKSSCNAIGNFINLEDVRVSDVGEGVGEGGSLSVGEGVSLTVGEGWKLTVGGACRMVSVKASFEV
jgi:hypothetical protein